MLREETVFGPISSRRLGNSLGINLLPTKGKICNFDCIYCECGWNRDGLADRRMPTAEEVRSALEAKLMEVDAESVPIDNITFSGDGEPTLNPEFARIVDDTIALRDRYCPSAQVSVLSNATRLDVPGVSAALKKVENPILKIDAPTNDLVARINRPVSGYDVKKVVESLEGFKGDFILQTMFLRSPDFDSSSSEVLDGWMNIVRKLRPRKVMVYTIARPTPSGDLSKFTEERMAELVRPLVEEGFDVSIYG